MEGYQKDHINRSMMQLMENTSCTTSLLARLTANGVLAQHETDSLLAMANDRTSQCLKFYWILQSRLRAFGYLLDALTIQKQTGAAAILKLASSEGETNAGANFSLVFHKNKILGSPNSTSRVYEGKFGTLNVAVKAINYDYLNRNSAQRELGILIDLSKESSSNIIKYYTHVEQSNGLLIAMELCYCNLAEFIASGNGTDKKSDLLQQLTRGLEYLHNPNRNIVHMNIKPENVLVNMLKDGSCSVKIADFGMSRKKNELIPYDYSFKAHLSAIQGTHGWIAPEYIGLSESTQHIEPTFEADMFSLGCLFYYVISDGRHLFGDPLHFMANLACGITKIQPKYFNPPLINFSWLIKAMVNRFPEQRPLCSQVLTHPSFWSSEYTTKLILDVQSIQNHNTAITKTCNENLHKRLIGLEHAGSIISNKWHVDLSPSLRDYVITEIFAKHRHQFPMNYLLSTIASTFMEHPRLTPEIRNTFGELFDDFLTYWLKRFPFLVSILWISFEDLKKESILRSYYTGFHQTYKKPSIMVEINKLMPAVMPKPTAKLTIEDIFLLVRTDYIIAMNKYFQDKGLIEYTEMQNFHSQTKHTVFENYNLNLPIVAHKRQQVEKEIEKLFGMYNKTNYINLKRCLQEIFPQTIASGELVLKSYPHSSTEWNAMLKSYVSEAMNAYLETSLSSYQETIKLLNISDPNIDKQFEDSSLKALKLFDDSMASGQNGASNYANVLLSLYQNFKGKLKKEMQITLGEYVGEQFCAFTLNRRPIVLEEFRNALKALHSTNKIISVTKLLSFLRHSVNVQNMKVRRLLGPVTNESIKTDDQVSLEIAKFRAEMLELESSFVLENIKEELRLPYAQFLLLFEFSTDTDVTFALVEAWMIFHQEMDKKFKIKDFFQAKFVLLEVAISTAIQHVSVQLSDKQFRMLEKAMSNSLWMYIDRLYISECTTKILPINVSTLVARIAVYEKSSAKFVAYDKETFSSRAKESIGNKSASREGVDTNLEEKNQNILIIFDIRQILEKHKLDLEFQNNFFSFTTNENGIIPDEKSIKILTDLRNNVNANFGEDFKDVAFTISSYCSQNEEESIIAASKIAGFANTLMIDESVAALYAYNLQYLVPFEKGKDERLALVFHLSKSTFEAAIVASQICQILVVGAGQNTEIGGDDFHKNMQRFCIQEFKNTHKIEFITNENLLRLEKECEKHKILLTTSLMTKMSVENICNNLSLTCTVTRQEFKDINLDLLFKIMGVVNEAIQIAGCSELDIDDIILVGGATRMPCIKDMLSQHFSRSKLHNSIPPDEVIVRGAALFAARELGKDLF